MLSSSGALVHLLVDVVCPQCTTIVRASAGTYARCPNCGYSGGSVPEPHQVQVFAPPHEFLPSNPLPQEEDEEDEAQAPKETSRVALTALILGLTGVIIPFAPPVAIGFGIAGLVHVNKNPETMQGKGLATIGLVFGVLTMTAWFIVMVMTTAAIGSMLPG